MSKIMGKRHWGVTGRILFRLIEYLRANPPTDGNILRTGDIIKELGCDMHEFQLARDQYRDYGRKVIKTFPIINFPDIDEPRDLYYKALELHHKDGFYVFEHLGVLKGYEWGCWGEPTFEQFQVINDWYVKTRTDWFKKYIMHSLETHTKLPFDEMKAKLGMPSNEALAILLSPIVEEVLEKLPSGRKKLTQQTLAPYIRKALPEEDKEYKKRLEKLKK